MQSRLAATTTEDGMKSNRSVSFKLFNTRKDVVGFINKLLPRDEIVLQ